MKKFKRNPFEIFGITPQLVKELKDETLFKLIKTIYKTLQLYYHPDRGGDPKKALELNLAFEALNYDKNPQNFSHFKKAYLQRLSRKTLRKELEELENNYRKLFYLNELLKERFWQFLEKGGDFFKEIYDRGFLLKIKVLDIVSHINFSDYVSFKRKKQFFKEIIFSNEDFVLKKEGLQEKYRKLKNYKYLGTVKRGYFEPWNFLVQSIGEEKIFLRNYLNKETFIREILIYLQPEIKTDSYLFWYNPKDPQKVYLEGLVLKLEEITQLEFLEILKNKCLNYDEEEIRYLSESKEVVI